jgi:hypothetical protein
MEGWCPAPRRPIWLAVCLNVLTILMAARIPGY